MTLKSALRPNGGCHGEKSRDVIHYLMMSANAGFQLQAQAQALEWGECATTASGRPKPHNQRHWQQRVSFSFRLSNHPLCPSYLPPRHPLGVSNPRCLALLAWSSTALPHPSESQPFKLSQKFGRSFAQNGIVALTSRVPFARSISPRIEACADGCHRTVITSARFSEDE